MTIQSWLMYLTLVLVATATPGPAVLYIVTNASIFIGFGLLLATSSNK